MSTPLWQPTPTSMQQSNVRQYQKWLTSRLGLHFTDYHQLWEWSINNVEDFWESLWIYFNVLHDGKFSIVRSKSKMPYNRWFEGSKLNYAEHIFRDVKQDQVAILYASEQKSIQTIKWKALTQHTAAFQNFLKSEGIGQGDCVAAYITCIPEATIAFLATNSLGAIWSSCSPDFGVQSVIDRFAQIKPKIIVAVDQYQYGGKLFDNKKDIESIAKAIPSIKKIILITDKQSTLNVPYNRWNKIMKEQCDSLCFTRVDFNHPMWVLYSSGTTGLPKAITHSHGGILLEQFKYHTFHHDIKRGEKYFWYTTTGWMMWNHVQASLLCGGVMAIYDGSPIYPDKSILWQFIQDAEINHFGTSAGYLMACKKAGFCPKEKFNLTTLREIGSTGSTLPSDGFKWVYENVKSDVWLTSMSGGTDVCSAFVGGNPLLPVYEGEIQCIALGCALDAWDENGKKTHEAEAVGEMVITKPMPSMPIYLWGDEDYERYKESYFKVYPNVWRHGDWISITDHKGVLIYGRSDATLNRGGIRIGTSEIYRVVNRIEEVNDSLIVCIEKGKGSFYMPLFVTLNNKKTLSDKLKSNISKAIREACSPRHVPDTIFQAPDIPYTISGKKIELPIKKIFMGYPIKKALNNGTLRNLESLEFYLKFYDQHLKN